MRDFDARQEQEARQQRLVEDIVDSLQRMSRGQNDYLDFYAGLARLSLQTMLGQPIETGHGTPNERYVFREMIADPIKIFTLQDTERRHLHAMVFQKIGAVIVRRVSNNSSSVPQSEDYPEMDSIA